MTVAETLRKARALIDTPEKWCQGVYCKGDALCSLGAIYAAGGGDRKDIPEDGDPHFSYESERAYRTLSAAISPKWVAPWNDAPERTHADVMALFDKAIALAEQEGR